MSTYADTHHPKGLDVCTDCGQHVDARIHHTPQRLSGAHGPAIGARMTQNPIHEGATLLAAALKPSGPAYGWGPLAGPAERALRDLMAAGWAPPVAGADGEAAKLRIEIERLHAHVDDLRGHLNRLSADDAAAQEFRGALVGAACEDARSDTQVAIVKADTEKRFTRWQVHELLLKVLDRCDRAAEAAHKRNAKQAADWTTQTERTQLALFGPQPAPAVQNVTAAGGVL